MRRFQKIDVNEPTKEDAIKILKGLKPYYEEHHKVRYTNEAMRRRLSCRPAISATASCRTRRSSDR